MGAVLERVTATVQPWADMYADSAVLSIAVRFLHLAGLLVAGGFALAFDRFALRLTNGPATDRVGFVAELTAVHRPVMIGLTVVTASGLALLLADVEYMLPSPVFWMKMGLFAVLLVNGLAIRAAGSRLGNDNRDPTAWRALRRGSIRSIGLWVVIVLAGVLLTNTV